MASIHAALFFIALVTSPMQIRAQTKLKLPVDVIIVFDVSEAVRAPTWFHSDYYSWFLTEFRKNFEVSNEAMRAAVVQVADKKHSILTDGFAETPDAVQNPSKGGNALTDADRKKETDFSILNDVRTALAIGDYRPTVNKMMIIVSPAPPLPQPPPSTTTLWEINFRATVDRIRGQYPPASIIIETIGKQNDIPPTGQLAALIWSTNSDQIIEIKGDAQNNVEFLVAAALPAEMKAGLDGCPSTATHGACYLHNGVCVKDTTIHAKPTSENFRPYCPVNGKSLCAVNECQTTVEQTKPTVNPTGQPATKPTGPPSSNLLDPDPDRDRNKHKWEAWMIALIVFAGLAILCTFVMAIVLAVVCTRRRNKRNSQQTSIGKQTRSKKSEKFNKNRQEEIRQQEKLQEELFPDDKSFLQTADILLRKPLQSQIEIKTSAPSPLLPVAPSPSAPEVGPLDRKSSRLSEKPSSMKKPDTIVIKKQ